MAALGSSRFRESAIVRNAQPEPLDDIGRLTAPREWAVLACLGLALAALVAWGLFGSVERTLRLDGVLVLSGERHTLRAGVPGTVAEVVSGDAGRIDAVAFVAPEEAWPLDSGMSARVTVASPVGDLTFRAGLAMVGPRDEGPPDWLVRMRPGVASRSRGHVLRLVLDRSAELAGPAGTELANGLLDGTPCRIEIVLDRKSPLGLLIRS